jgi:hypothetical protein
MLDSNLFQIVDNKIKFNNGKVIEFDFPIRKKNVLIVDFIIILMIQTPAKSTFNNNVFAVSNTGNFLWQIDMNEPYFNGRNCPFVEMRLNESGNLLLFNWCSMAYVVNPITGIILDKYISQ